ncbi:hypothetical protein Q9Q95_13285 [Sphingomonas sp. DG1-23]|uniref:hypothetical protein n=1 Tax=Sphingomonas sp. DG1-23 TaxID=3068316 RepID=UPI00273DB93E|nr:hypothetical protein [Sphingomonas sp. DG1-23]MDP5279902.1 hypothetical protein [Sphingomonas sp. DG1-23]
MTVTVETTIAGPYSPNGATTTFGFAFKAMTVTEISVYRGGVAPEQLVSPALYDVALDANEGGTVTFTIPPATGSGEIYIVSAPSFQQQASFPGGEVPFTPKAMNTQLDRAAVRDLHLLSRVGRAVQTPFDEVGFTLPKRADRRGLALWDAVSGDLTAGPLDVGLSGANPIVVKTRALLSLVSGPTDGQPATLTEGGLTGSFVWRTGNYASRVTADTQQGIYVQSTLPGFGPTVGCWVRQTPIPGQWFADWFNIPNDPAAGNGNGGGTEVLAHTQLTAMINVANIDKPHTIIFGSKIYTLGAQIPEWNFQVTLLGSRGAQGTIFVKRYAEANAARGVFAFNDNGFTLSKLTFRGISGVGGGGSAISAILTRAAPADGRTYLIDVYVSMGTSCNYAVYINGLTNTDPTGPSYRGVFVHGGEYFGAAVATWAMVGVNHWLCAGTFSSTSGTSTANVVLQSAGTSDTYNDDWQYFGILAGVCNLTWLRRCQFVSPQTDSITVDANSQTSQWTGPRVSGAVTNGSGAGFCTSWDGMIVSSGGNATTGWRKWGSGKIEQWGTATTSGGVIADQTLPVAFTSTAIQYKPQRAADAGANQIGLAHMYPGTNPNTQYTIKSINLNYSAIAIGAAGAFVRWEASGQ